MPSAVETRQTAREEAATSVLPPIVRQGAALPSLKAAPAAWCRWRSLIFPVVPHVFSAGFITYSADAKKRQLDVSSEILETFGEVSLATAWAMAAGVLANSDADVAVSITGIAARAADRTRKPVGIVVFSAALRGQDPDDYFTQRVQFDLTDRATICHHATMFALDLLQLDKDALRPSEDVTLPAP